ncbi:MAG: hypothetical protein ACR5LG_02460 [Sodalis sp. (in: enterobacteria)]
MKDKTVPLYRPLVTVVGGADGDEGGAFSRPEANG